MRRFFVLSCLLFVGFIITGSTFGQCVQCTPHPDGFICTSSGGSPGGTGCRTPDLFTCTLIGPCFPGGDRPVTDKPNGDKRSCELKPTIGPFVSVDDSIIREIGLQDARLALAVLNTSAIRFEFSEAKTSFLSVEYNPQDVENQLKKTRDPGYVSELKSRANSAKEIDPSIFEYKAVITDSASGLTMSIYPVGFKGSSVDFSLERLSAEKGKSVGYRALGYQLK